MLTDDDVDAILRPIYVEMDAPAATYEDLLGELGDLRPASQQGGPNENYDDLLRELQRPAKPAPPPIPAKPAPRPKPAPQQPPPLPKHPPPDLVYESLLEDLDREDAMMNRRNARRNARRRNRARRVGIEPPAYVNAVALPGGASESSLSDPPPPYA